MTNKQAIYLKKLSYLTKYRGCRECDILLGSFAIYLPTLNPVELALYEALLHENDNDIMAWLTQRQTSDKYQIIIDKIINIHNSNPK